jgi:hypothetical protein
VDALEQLVARRLDELGADHRPVPGVLEQALVAVERKRRRRQGVAVLTSGLGALALVAGVTALGLGDGGETPVDLPAPASLEQVPVEQELAELLGTTTASLLPREHGWFDLRGRSLTADGTFLGGEQHYDPQWFDTWGQAQVVDLSTGAVEAFDETTDFDVEADTWLAGADADSRLALEHLDPQHKLDLVCTPRVGGERTQLSDGSVAESSVHVDAGHVVWSMYPEPGEDRYEVWTADGCGGTPTRLEATGLVRAVSWPHVYLSTPDEPWLVRVDATTGEREDLVVADLPQDVLPGAVAAKEHVGVDASQDHLAWTDGDDLVVLGLGSGAAEVVSSDLSVVSGSNGSTVRVGVGDRFVSWSTSPVDGDPARSQGLLHDPATGRTVAIDGEVWTKGPWVVWQADDGYRVVRTG